MKPRVRRDTVIKEVRRRKEKAPRGYVRVMVTIFFEDVVSPRTCRAVKCSLYRRPRVEKTWTQRGNSRQVGMKIMAHRDKIDKLVEDMIDIARNIATKFSRSTSPGKHPTRKPSRIRRSERRGPVHRVTLYSTG